MGLFYLLVGMCLAYEIHKLIDFRFFGRLTYIMLKYKNQLEHHKTNKITNSIIKVSITDLFYIFVLIIGIFGFQSLGFGSILILSIISNNIMKNANKKITMIVFLIDSVLSALILILILTNFYFFRMESLEFIKHVISFI